MASEAFILRASSVASRRTSESVSLNNGAMKGAIADGIACRASIAAARSPASCERRYGNIASTLAASPMRISAVMMASRTRGTVSPTSAAASAGTASAWPASARAAAHRLSASELSSVGGLRSQYR